MVHVLPQLPYSNDALEPAISAETVDYHYGIHYKGYIDNLNRLVKDTPYENMELEEIVKTADGAIFNNAAQAWNHDLYFLTLSPTPGEMPDVLKEKLVENFGSVEEFKTKFLDTCAAHFGSGWVWLSVDDKGELSIVALQNAGNPLTQGLKPILVIDVWEHSYYIDYRNRRAPYLEAVWNLIDWPKVAERFSAKK